MPSVLTSRNTARSMNRLRLPFGATRSSTATVKSGRMMLMRLLIRVFYELIISIGAVHTPSVPIKYKGCQCGTKQITALREGETR